MLLVLCAECVGTCALRLCVGWSMPLLLRGDGVLCGQQAVLLVCILMDSGVMCVLRVQLLATWPSLCMVHGLATAFRQPSDNERVCVPACCVCTVRAGSGLEAMHATWQLQCMLWMQLFVSCKRQLKRVASYVNLIIALALDVVFRHNLLFTCMVPCCACLPGVACSMSTATRTHGCFLCVVQGSNSLVCVLGCC